MMNRFQMGLRCPYALEGRFKMKSFD